VELTVRVRETRKIDKAADESMLDNYTGGCTVDKTIHGLVAYELHLNGQDSRWNDTSSRHDWPAWRDHTRRNDVQPRRAARLPS